MMRLNPNDNLEDPLAALQEDQDNLSDDDNAADMQPEIDDVEKEDPLLLAIDDLEGRIVSALDDLKLHPGVRSSSIPGSPNVHEELSTLLRPVLEVAAHTGPSVARTYYHGIGSEGIEASCEDVYQRVVSDLTLPVVLECAQSDPSPPKRAAALEFFRALYQECKKAGSWLDTTTTGPQMGPYGAGSTSSHSSHASMSNPAMRTQQKRRFAKRLAREGEILRYWIQASIACTVQGVFTNEASEVAVASRGIIAASASLRPCLKHIAQRIKDADDRGASKLFAPVMKMVEGVLKKLFLSSAEETAGAGDAIRSSSIKFLEILTLVCARKPAPDQNKRRGHTGNSEDFSLEDLPAGHPVITKESLESIAEYSFAILRGLTLLGGQVKIDENLLSDMLMTGGADSSPAAQVVSILKPAALAFLEMESSFQSNEDEPSLETTIDHSNIDFDFALSQKPYSLTLNAISALALNRPAFFKESAVCLAKRAVNPPTFVEGGALTKAGVLAISAHLKASCLTLLRNALSITANASSILHEALKRCDMEIQADKALKMANQANALKTAGRAARNRANMFYEWDSSEGDKRTSKRQRETDDALAKMRAAKKARGLGHGIQLPQNMADAVELVIANLQYLPSKKPQTGSSRPRKVPITLDFVVDAIVTNGASLAQEDGRWYDRDGGNAWEISLESEEKYRLSSKFVSKVASTEIPTKKAGGDGKTKDPKLLFHEQAQSAASDALGRIIMQSMTTQNKFHAEFGNAIASRLAWTLRSVKPSAALQASHSMASSSVSSMKKRLESEEEKHTFDEFVETYPLVNACLAWDSTTRPESATSASKKSAPSAESEKSLSQQIMYEAYAQSMETNDDGTTLQKVSRFYEQSVDVFVASVVHASERSDEKPADTDRRRVAAETSSSIQRVLGSLPSLTPSTLKHLSAMCDIEEITKKAAEAARKTSQHTIAASAATHAAKVAAEKRATTCLLILRDIAFTRSDSVTRKGAVECAVMIASGRLPASAGIEDKALKLVMNVLYPKSDSLASLVIEAASDELKKAATYAAGKYEEIAAMNKKNETKTAEQYSRSQSNIASSILEGEVMEYVKKPAVLFMALCVRRPEIIKILFEVSCRDKADALAKAVRANMSKLARAAAAKHGAAAIAKKVADVASDNETSLVLSFLDNLAPSTDKTLPGQDLIDACYEIQTSKAGEDGKKDARYIIPVVSAMKRKELVEKLPEFVAADDKVFLAALQRMNERCARQALLFRDEPDEANPSLRGMTLCEQLVYLHNLDFAEAGLPQKRYLDAIRLCLDNDETYNDRVVMSALDHMSGVFLTGVQGLPLAYMRTIILVCSKHESLHSWITSLLLPRLVEGKIYTDRRQWEGWMRCAKMLENTGEGVSSLQAIRQLPEEQYELYRTRYGEPGQSSSS